MPASFNHDLLPETREQVAWGVCQVLQASCTMVVSPESRQIADRSGAAAEEVEGSSLLTRGTACFLAEAFVS